MSNPLKFKINPRLQVIRFHPNGAYIATGSTDRTVRMWSAQDGRTVRLFQGHRAGVMALAFSHDGRLLASAGTSGNYVRRRLRLICNVLRSALRFAVLRFTCCHKWNRIHCRAQSCIVANRMTFSRREMQKLSAQRKSNGCEPRFTLDASRVVGHNTVCGSWVWGSRLSVLAAPFSTCTGAHRIQHESGLTGLAVLKVCLFARVYCALLELKMTSKEWVCIVSMGP